MELTNNYTQLQRTTLHVLLPLMGSEDSFNIEKETGVPYEDLVNATVQIMKSAKATFIHRAAAANLLYFYVSIDKSRDFYEALYEAIALPETVTFIGLTKGAPIIPPQYDAGDFDVSDTYLHIVKTWRIVLETSRDLEMEHFVRGKYCSPQWIVALAMWGSFCPNEDLGT